MRVEAVPGRTFWTELCKRTTLEDLQVGDRFAWMDNLRRHPLRRLGAVSTESVPIMVVRSVGEGFVEAEQTVP